MKSDNYQEIFNLIGEPVVLVDNSKGKILEVNSAAAQVYGYLEVILQHINK